MKIQINNFCCFVVPSMFLLVDNMFILKRITFFTTLLTRKHFQLEHAKHWRPFNWALHTHWLNLRIIMMYLLVVPKPKRKDGSKNSSTYTRKNCQYFWASKMMLNRDRRGILSEMFVLFQNLIYNWLWKKRPRLEKIKLLKQ